MKILTDLYHIESMEGRGESTVFTIRLNAGSPIYAAHFPGNPITPGVCLVQIGLELAERLARKEMEISEVKNVKFTNILSPAEHPVVEYVFMPLAETAGEVKARAEVRDGDMVFTSMSMTCR